MGKKKVRQPSFSPKDGIFLQGGSDLDAETDKIDHDYSDRDDIGDSDEYECIKNIASDLSHLKWFEEPIKNYLARVFNSLWVYLCACVYTFPL